MLPEPDMSNSAGGQLTATTSGLARVIQHRTGGRRDLPRGTRAGRLVRLAVLLACLLVASAPSAASATTTAETQAVNWATAQIGSTSWDGLCLSFVYDAYQNGAGINLRNDTSGVTYNSNTDPQDVWGHTATGTTGTGEPPYGALVFFDAKSGYDPEDYSHVAIMGANGEMISTNDAFNESTIHYETLQQEQGSGSYSTYVGWWLPDGSGSGGDGSFVQVAGSAAIYEIAGGAPLYVSNWSAVGGSQPYSVISQQQFDSLNPVPANGALLRDQASGNIWIVAGGAPLYVSSCAAIDTCSGALNIDPAAVATLNHLNAVPSNGTLLRDKASGAVYTVAGGAPLYVSSCSAIDTCANAVDVDAYAISHLDHLNAVPSNGTLVRDKTSGAIYILAGGAPLYVSSCAAIDGCDGAVDIDPSAVSNLNHLNAVPADGTLLRDKVSGAVYIVAGGAPLYVSSCAAIDGCSGVVDIDAAAISTLNHLRATPADGTFIRDKTSGQIWRVAGGAPFAISTCNYLNGCPGSVDVDPYAVTHQNHLTAAAADGTVVEGLPSGTYWSFSGGRRTAVPAQAGVTAVDDAGLAAFPQPVASTPPAPGNGPGATGSGGGGSGAAGSAKPTSSGSRTSGSATCLVPRLKGLTVAKARAALSQAHCGLGALERAKHDRGHTLHVIKQSVRAGTNRPVGYRVSVTVR
jgi:cell wall-associated NlpC family hydrolase